VTVYSNTISEWQNDRLPHRAPTSQGCSGPDEADIDAEAVLREVGCRSLGGHLPQLVHHPDDEITLPLGTIRIVRRQAFRNAQRLLVGRQRPG
jgi:hypothetical protein